MSDNRPAVYWEDDVLVFRASAFGNCDGELIRHGLEVPGEPVPEWLQVRFDEGTRGEQDIIDALCRQLNIVPDLDTMGDNQLEVEYRVGRSLIRCHPDGTGVMYDDEAGEDIPVVIEVKLLGKDAKATYDRHGIGGLWSYDWQASIEMLATGRVLAYGVATKDADGNPMRDKDGNVVVEATIFRKPPRSEKEIKTRLLKLNAMIRQGSIPECSKRQYPCPFYQYPDVLCNTWEQGVRVEWDIDEATRQELSLQGSIYRTAKAKEAKWKETAQLARDEILKLFEKIGVKDKGQGVGPIRLMKGRSRGKYDEKLAKADGVDLKKYWVEGKEYSYIKIEADDAVDDEADD